MDPYEHEPLLTGYDSYEMACERFEWDLPETYNIAADLVATHSDAATRTALLFEADDGSVERFTFADIDSRTNQVANLLVEEGLETGDRVAVILPDVPATAYSHMAVYKAGGILVPLSHDFGPDDLQYRLGDSDAQYLVTTSTALDTISAFSDLDSDYSSVLTIEPDDRADVNLEDARSSFDDSFETCETALDDPALMLYTSGTTGDPKGVLHAHRFLMGYYPGFEMWNDLRIDSDRVFWSNGEWSFTGSLIAHFYSTWHYGGTYVTTVMEDTQDPDAIFEMLANHDVNNTFIRPGDLEAMMESRDEPPELDGLDVVSTGGAPYGDELIEWIETSLDATPVEIYGQTEANMFVSECPSWFDSRPGTLGRQVPGADVGVINQHGEEVGPGAVGELALKDTHPVVFERYWNKPEKTASAFIDHWTLTESMCERDEEGYFAFVARKDDIIAIGDHYVSPVAVESVVNEHPDVEASGVVQASGGETAGTKAYVTLTDDATSRAENAILDSISRHATERLSPHEVPDELAVIDEIPTTKRGKVRRTELRDDAN